MSYTGFVELGIVFDYIFNLRQEFSKDLDRSKIKRQAQLTIRETNAPISSTSNFSETEHF